MLGTIEMPIWLLVLVVGFAGITFASHFLFPSVRWFFRKRMERVVARVNARLDRPIEPFKLARRQDMIVRLTYDPAVLEAVTDHARESGVPGSVAFEEAKRYAREIVPAFSASLYFGVAIRLARGLSRAIYRVRVGKVDAALAHIDPRATVIFVMNHRSNMDYVLITWLVSNRAAISYAVGNGTGVATVVPDPGDGGVFHSAKIAQYAVSPRVGAVCANGYSGRGNAGNFPRRRAFVKWTGWFSENGAAVLYCGRIYPADPRCGVCAGGSGL